MIRSDYDAILAEIGDLYRRSRQAKDCGNQTTWHLLRGRIDGIVWLVRRRDGGDEAQRLCEEAAREIGIRYKRSQSDFCQEIAP